jgi:hypothetical protein
MAEAEWLNATDPRSMLDWLRRSGKADRRRIGQLFVACCDRIPPSATLMTDRDREHTSWPDDDDPIALTQAEVHLSGAVLEAMRSLLGVASERSALVGIIRDIFGNPFGPVAFDPRWRTADVLGLASGIYEDRAFDRLPLLADALMDAGCDSDDILSHCRGEGPHVRGCWVVDLVLGKE